MPSASTLVLFSGGLDSAVLLAHEAQTAYVLPLYVSVGLAWEQSERAMLTRLLSSPVFDGRVASLNSVEFTMRDVYSSSHWAVRGVPPAYDTPDEDVYLAGRNLVLLTKAAVVAASRRIGRIALGPLAGNPFPDATPAFFSAMGRAVSIGLDQSLSIAAPFLSMHKEDVIRRGAELQVPMEYTLSCMSPVLEGDLPLHCGLCSKCRERRDAFSAAGIEDPARYASPPPR
jgi:7-cyano-7-deazaguanine synthase